MADEKKLSVNALFDRYPWRIIIFRWFLVALEMGLGSFLVFAFRLELGLLFLVYGVISVFILLPAIRCVRCYYYGKRCNFGWGEWVSKIFPRDEKSDFYSHQGYSLLLWPLRIVPIGMGLLVVIGSLSGNLELLNLGLFGGYLLVIFIHRSFYRSRACSRCRQIAICPVYDKQIMSALIEKSELV